MPIIPKEYYSRVEAMLRTQKARFEAASNRVTTARARATSTGAPISSIGAHSGYSTGKLENAVIEMLEAEEELCVVMKWQEVFSRADEALKHQSEIVHSIYEGDEQQKAIAESVGVDRQSIKRMKDTYICHCAIYAAQKGLLK